MKPRIVKNVSREPAEILFYYFFFHYGRSKKTYIYIYIDTGLRLKENHRQEPASTMRASFTQFTHTYTYTVQPSLPLNRGVIMHRMYMDKYYVPSYIFI